MSNHQQDLQTLTPEEYGLIRDIVVPFTRTAENTVEFDKIEQAVCYLGDVRPRRLFAEGDNERFAKILNVLGKISGPIQEGKRRFRIEHEGKAYRCQVGVRPKGEDVSLRELPQKTPSLADLSINAANREILMAQDHLNGGLIIISGLNGNGKTTTASATVRSRLEKFGGHANTIEDPTELPLDGSWTGANTAGYCAQRPADELDEPGNPGSGYRQALYEVARQFPSFTGGGTILLIGEIRDADTAIEALNAALAGHLVISTVHSPSAPAALDRIVNLATQKHGVDSEAIRELLATHLTAIFHQRLSYGEDSAGGEPVPSDDRWKQATVRGEVLVMDIVSSGEANVSAAIMKPGAAGRAALAKIASAQTSALEGLQGNQLTFSNIRHLINEASKIK